MAEVSKLEAETRMIHDELQRPWYRKRYFFQAITAGLVALPLVWFYFEKVALPLNRSENIEQELKNAEERKRLASRNDHLEKATFNLAAARQKLESQRDELIAEKKKLVAQVKKHQETVAAIESQLKSVVAQSRQDKAKLETLQQSLRTSSTRASQLEADIQESLTIQTLLSFIAGNPDVSMTSTFNELSGRLPPDRLSQLSTLIRSALEEETGRKLPADLVENHGELTMIQLWELVLSESRSGK
ncbi:MAG TPA: hypothetical protein VF179_33365 [Thermoanaerobaculia bacterium]|nr:hypothetical protein [Thermoanaerobaculia bacterium]